MKQTNYLDVESTVYKEIQKKCVELDITISDLCRKSGVDRIAASQLQLRETKAVTNIKKLVNTLNVIELEQSKNNTHNYEHLGGNENEFIN